MFMGRISGYREPVLDIVAEYSRKYIPLHCSVKKSFIPVNLCGRNNAGKRRFAGT